MSSENESIRRLAEDYESDYDDAGLFGDSDYESFDERFGGRARFRASPRVGNAANDVGIRRFSRDAAAKRFGHRIPIPPRDDSGRAFFQPGYIYARQARGGEGSHGGGNAFSAAYAAIRVDQQDAFIHAGYPAAKREGAASHA
jgi:hypothetical protein